MLPQGAQGEQGQGQQQGKWWRPGVCRRGLQQRCGGVLKSLFKRSPPEGPLSFKPAAPLGPAVAGAPGPFVLRPQGPQVVLTSGGQPVLPLAGSGGSGLPPLSGSGGSGIPFPGSGGSGIPLPGSGGSIDAAILQQYYAGLGGGMFNGMQLGGSGGSGIPLVGSGGSGLPLAGAFSLPEQQFAIAGAWPDSSGAAFASSMSLPILPGYAAGQASMQQGTTAAAAKGPKSRKARPYKPPDQVQAEKKKKAEVQVQLKHGVCCDREALA